MTGWIAFRLAEVLSLSFWADGAPYTNSLMYYESATSITDEELDELLSAESKLTETFSICLSNEFTCRSSAYNLASERL